MSKPCDWDSHEKYELLIGPIRERARELGYAIAVHGTLIRDIDLIAVPWTLDAVSASVLAQAIKLVIEKVNGCAYMGYTIDKPAEFSMAGCPGRKPHGRLCWTFTLQRQQGPYIDLSVTPRT